MERSAALAAQKKQNQERAALHTARPGGKKAPPAHRTQAARIAPVQAVARATILIREERALHARPSADR